MCGIAGIYSFKTSVHIEPLKKMAEALAHRGPDGEGFWVSEDNNLGLAHRRLSIIDLSKNASQPMQYKNRYTITFNGEIYNYIELKADLKKKGYCFYTNSDTEVLLALYAEYETECLSRIDGMFAFAIYDNLTKYLFLARDRFGEKPLFYIQNDQGFHFASEMKSFFATGTSKEISPDRIYKYLQYNLVYDDNDPESTFYKGIYQLPAGTFLLLKHGKIISKKKYWSLDDIELNRDISFEDAVEKYKNLLTKSIKRRLRSDVAVGSSLSGGLDSSAIVLIINKYKEHHQTQKTFSARFSNFEKDEGRFMEKVINYGKGISPEFVWPNAEELLDDLEHLVYHQEEPFISGSIYAQYKVMKLAREKNVTVLLDGQGADEQLGGYIKYYYHYLSYLLTKNPKLFINEKYKFNELNKGMQTTYSIPRRLPFWLLKSRITKTPYRYDTELRSILKADTLSNSLGPLLRYADRNSMAFSREVRLPFLSHELVEFTFSLPIKYILNEGWTKYILRKSVENIVPAEIAWRKDKIGYEPPQHKWDAKIADLICKVKKGNKYLDYTNGQKVTSKINDWQWLMLKQYNES